MSLTTGERQALSWLLAVLVVGAGARLVGRRGEGAAADPQAGEALRRQLVAVDSAQRADARPRRSRRASAGRTRRARASPSVDSLPTPSAMHEPVQPPTLVAVDVDQADSVALEKLPRIGPALAARIVADREKQGPFGSVEGLQRVRGIGPKLAVRLAPLVTFSGTPRRSAVQR